MDQENFQRLSRSRRSLRASGSERQRERRRAVTENLEEMDSYRLHENIASPDVSQGGRDQGAGNLDQGVENPDQTAGTPASDTTPIESVVQYSEITHHQVMLPPQQYVSTDERLQADTSISSSSHGFAHENWPSTEGRSSANMPDLSSQTTPIQDESTVDRLPWQGDESTELEAGPLDLSFERNVSKSGDDAGESATNKQESRKGKAIPRVLVPPRIVISSSSPPTSPTSPTSSKSPRSPVTPTSSTSESRSDQNRYLSPKVISRFLFGSPTSRTVAGSPTSSTSFSSSQFESPPRTSVAENPTSSPKEHSPQKLFAEMSTSSPTSQKNTGTRNIFSKLKLKLSPQKVFSKSKGSEEMPRETLPNPFSNPDTDSRSTHLSAKDASILSTRDQGELSTRVYDELHTAESPLSSGREDYIVSTGEYGNLWFSPRARLDCDSDTHGSPSPGDIGVSPSTPGLSPASSNTGISTSHMERPVGYVESFPEGEGGHSSGAPQGYESILAGYRSQEENPQQESEVHRSSEHPLADHPVTFPLMQPQLYAQPEYSGQQSLGNLPLHTRNIDPTNVPQVSTSGTRKISTRGKSKNAKASKKSNPNVSLPPSSFQGHQSYQQAASHSSVGKQKESTGHLFPPERCESSKSPETVKPGFVQFISSSRLAPPSPVRCMPVFPNSWQASPAGDQSHQSRPFQMGPQGFQSGSGQHPVPENREAPVRDQTRPSTLSEHLRARASLSLSPVDQPSMSMQPSRHQRSATAISSVDRGSSQNLQQWEYASSQNPESVHSSQSTPLDLSISPHRQSRQFRTRLPSPRSPPSLQPSLQQAPQRRYQDNRPQNLSMDQDPEPSLVDRPQTLPITSSHRSVSMQPSVQSRDEQLALQQRVGFSSSTSGLSQYFPDRSQSGVWQEMPSSSFSSPLPPHASYQHPSPNYDYQSQHAFYGLPFIGDQQPPTIYQPVPTGHRQPGTEHRQPHTGHRQPAVCYWHSAMGYGQSSGVHGQPSVGYQPRLSPSVMQPYLQDQSGWISSLQQTHRSPPESQMQHTHRSPESQMQHTHRYPPESQMQHSHRSPESQMQHTHRYPPESQMQHTHRSPPESQMQRTHRSPPESQMQRTHRAPPESQMQRTHRSPPESQMQRTHRSPPESQMQRTHRSPPESQMQRTHRSPPESQMQHSHRYPLESQMQHTHRSPPESQMQHTHRSPPESQMQHTHRSPPESQMQHTHRSPPESQMQHTHRSPPESQMQHTHRSPPESQMQHTHRSPPESQMHQTQSFSPESLMQQIHISSPETQMQHSQSSSESRMERIRGFSPESQMQHTHSSPPESQSSSQPVLEQNPMLTSLLDKPSPKKDFKDIGYFFPHHLASRSPHGISPGQGSPGVSPVGDRQPSFNQPGVSPSVMQPQFQDLSAWMSSLQQTHSSPPESQMQQTQSISPESQASSLPIVEQNPILTSLLDKPSAKKADVEKMGVRLAQHSASQIPRRRSRGQGIPRAARDRASVISILEQTMGQSPVGGTSSSQETSSSSSLAHSDTQQSSSAVQPSAQFHSEQPPPQRSSSRGRGSPGRSLLARLQTQPQSTPEERDPQETSDQE